MSWKEMGKLTREAQCRGFQNPQEMIAHYRSLGWKTRKISIELDCYEKAVLVAERKPLVAQPAAAPNGSVER